MGQGCTAFRREKFLIEDVFFGLESAFVEGAALAFSFVRQKEEGGKHILNLRRKFSPPGSQTSAGNLYFIAMAAIK